MKNLYRNAALGGALSVLSSCSMLPPKSENLMPGDWHDGLTHLAESRPLPPAAKEEPCGRDFTVLTYNIRALPTNLQRDKSAFQVIAGVMAKRRAEGTLPDVVVLQEAWTEKYVKPIRDAAAYPYRIEGSAWKSSWLLGNTSGLEIWSTHPITSTVTEEFRRSDLVESLADKSMAHVKLAVEGVPEDVEIFTTHMNAAARSTVMDDIRLGQINDIADMYRRNGFGKSPSIMAADFNIDPSRASYYYFLYQFPQFHEAGVYCLTRDDCKIEIEDPRQIKTTDVWRTSHDHQFFAYQEGAAVQVRPVKLTLNFAEQVNGKPVSDHWGYEVKYRLSWACKNSQAPELKQP